MSKSSIFKRLFVNIAALLLLLFCLSSVLVYYSISEQLNRSKDAELVSSSHALWDSIRGSPDSSRLLPKVKEAYRRALSPDSQWRTMRVWKDHTLIFQSDDSGLKDAPEAKPDFSEQKLGNNIWRTYAFYVREENIIIEVSENLFSRNLLIHGIFKGFLESSVLLLPLLALLLFISLRHGLQGLTHMERLLAQRGPQSLEHIDTSTLPEELQPLQRAINFLLGELKNKITQERQLIDNAAHELRTPLTTLKLHAQLAAEAANEHDRRESMGDLLSTIDRTMQLVEQLLALSRIATEQAIRTPVLLKAVAAQVLQEHTATAAARHIALTLEGEDKAEAFTHEGLLHILLGVLLDNAVKYTPDHGKVNVRISSGGIGISDTGPGIARQDREKVFERFYRGKHGVQGSGLGLAIARQICELLGISIELADTSEAQGLLVSLSFPKQS